MTQLEKLIAEHCPNGVEYVPLGVLGEFKNNGVDKKKNDTQKPILLLNYMDVYRNKYLTASIPTMEVTASDKQILECSVQKLKRGYRRSNRIVWRPRCRRHSSFENV